MSWDIRGVVRRLPEPVQIALRSWRFRRSLQTGSSTANEPEFHRLHEWVGPGDAVLDVGANYGVYTARFSALVGPAGVVIALEPLRRTFRALALHSRHFLYDNVTLVNAAASDRCGHAALEVPEAAGDNPDYFARLAESREGGESVATIELDRLRLDRPFSFVKIDTEGHEAAVLRGMTGILEEDRPRLLLEGGSAEITRYLTDRGYREEPRLPGSPNRMFIAAT